MTTPAPQPGLHLVIFAGHQIDQPGRSQPRFPETQEQRARTLIREKLEVVRAAGTPITVLASAAPGADIIGHEVCSELGIESTVCLPMPRNRYAALIFGELDAWHSRYLKVSAPPRRVLELSDQAGLPRWLQRPDLNPWERGNRWVLQMAQTTGAAKVTLIAFWDRKTEGDGPGGTAHMVMLARKAGNIEVIIIETAELSAEQTGGSCY